jgi:hypothetical protein
MGAHRRKEDKVMKIDLMADLDWSETHMENRCRAEVASIVPEARQNELRTIMLGHLAGMRAATESELAEIDLVKSLVEQAGQDLIQARADMALLREAWAVEAARATLAQPIADGDAVDGSERTAAQAVLDGASADALALAAKRTSFH